MKAPKHLLWLAAAIIILSAIIALGRMTSLLPHGLKGLGSGTGHILLLLVIWEFLSFLAKKALPKNLDFRKKILKFFHTCHCPIGKIFGAIIVLHLACTLTFPPCLVQITGLLTACCFFWVIHQIGSKTAKPLQAHRHLALLAVFLMIIHIISHIHH